MADLSFLDDLKDNQLVVADKIITKAKEMGVDPRLALALAYVESNKTLSNSVKGTSGEVGVMQVMPDTARSMGYHPKDLHDEDKNIAIGLQYLKQNMDRYNDPQLAALAYNAGPDHPFFQNKAEPPASSVRYLNLINQYGGFSGGAEKPSDGDEGRAVDVAQNLPDEETSQVPVRSDTPAAAVVGALGGSLIGSGLNTRAGAASQAAQAAQAARTAPGGTPVQKWAGAMGYGDRGAQTFGQAYQFEKGTRTGAAIRNPATGQVFKPTFNFPKPPVVPPPTVGQRMVSGLTNIGKVAASHPVMTGALTGAGVAAGGVEAAERYRRGDVPGAVISGLGAVGSGVAAIPHPMTRAVGTGMALASPAALQILDLMRSKAPQQGQGTLSNVDQMGNPLPQ